MFFMFHCFGIMADLFIGPWKIWENISNGNQSIDRSSVGEYLERLGYADDTLLGNIWSRLEKAQIKVGGGDINGAVVTKMYIERIFELARTVLDKKRLNVDEVQKQAISTKDEDINRYERAIRGFYAKIKKFEEREEEMRKQVQEYEEQIATLQSKVLEASVMSNKNTIRRGRRITTSNVNLLAPPTKLDPARNRSSFSSIFF